MSVTGILHQFPRLKIAQTALCLNFSLLKHLWYMYSFCFKYIRISIFKTDIGDELYLDVTYMKNEETAPRSKHGVLI